MTELSLRSRKEVLIYIMVRDLNWNISYPEGIYLLKTAM